MKNLGFDSTLIKHDLSSYYEMLIPNQRRELLKKYVSIEDYVQILYTLKFIKRLSYNEMAKILGIRNINVYLRLYDFGFGYDGSFEDNLQQHKQKKTELQEIKSKAFSMDIDKCDPGLSELYSKAKKCRKDTYESIGFKSPVQYANVMNYLVKKKELTRIEIAIMFDCHNMTMYHKLRKLGLNLDHAAAHKVKRKRERHDYKRTGKNIRQTQLKMFYKEGLIGTVNENAVRSIMDYVLPDYLDIERYEIIVGVNTRNIISPMEVDIPVVIIDKQTTKVFKIAIEYNGDSFHEDDEKKIEALGNKGWIYFSVVEMGSTKKQREFGAIESQIEEICLRVKNML